MSQPENQCQQLARVAWQGWKEGGKPEPKDQQWGFAAVILWLFGFIFSGVGADQLLTSLRCGDSPRKIDCAQLAESGPPGSDFITLTNFKPNLDGYIYWQDERGNWTSADVPLFDTGGDTPRVIVRFQQPHNADNLRNAVSQPEITGLVKGRGLFPEPAAMMTHYNPGMDPGSCWIVALGERPYDKRLVTLAFVGGLALLTASIWILVEKYRPGKPGASVLPHMSPLLMLFGGLHALARYIPLSRRACGVVLLPIAAAFVVYGGYRFVELAAPRTVLQMSAELYCIGAIQIGVSMLVLSGSFLLVQADPAT